MVIVDRLKKQYGDFQLDLSLEIPDGKVTGIIGKNGAGKSTTIKAILGLIKPDAGTVTINGRETSCLEAKDKENIGACLSDSGFSMYLNVEDIIHILKKMYSSFDESSFRSFCTSQGLPLKKQIKDFSTGMRAKLRVISAITHRADLLVMDEPTAGLDVEARIEILDMLRDYISRNENCSIIMTSHISTDLEGLCDDIYLIHDGKVIVHEDTEVIKERYAVLRMDEETFEKLDKSHILRSRKEAHGYICFTDQKQFYVDMYPDIRIENGTIDDLILMMTGGAKR